MAGALLGSVPVALVYSFFVEYYVTGLTRALKELRGGSSRNRSADRA